MSLLSPFTIFAIHNKEFKHTNHHERKILVTGGTGYIGSHSTVELQNAGYEVVIIDNLSNSNIEVLDGIERITGKRPTFVQADCTDMEALRQLSKRIPDKRDHTFRGEQSSGRIGSKTFALLPQQSNVSC